MAGPQKIYEGDNYRYGVEDRMGNWVEFDERTNQPLENSPFTTGSVDALDQADLVNAANTSSPLTPLQDYSADRLADAQDKYSTESLMEQAMSLFPSYAASQSGRTSVPTASTMNQRQYNPAYNRLASNNAREEQGFIRNKLMDNFANRQSLFDGITPQAIYDDATNKFMGRMDNTKAKLDGVGKLMSLFGG